MKKYLNIFKRLLKAFKRYCKNLLACHFSFNDKLKDFERIGYADDL